MRLPFYNKWIIVNYSDASALQPLPLKEDTKRDGSLLRVRP